MRAFKFLRAGAVARFSGFEWPLPDDGPGEWVEAVPARCATGVHACRAGQLPYWLDDELWEIELDGQVLELGHKLVAQRGRLDRRVDEWDEQVLNEFARACLDRLGESAGDDSVVARYEADARRFLAAGEPAFAAFVAARWADLDGGLASYEGERAWQAGWLVDRLALSVA
jgi:hypothetical protein